MYFNRSKKTKLRPNYIKEPSIAILLTLLITSVALSAHFNFSTLGRQAFGQSSNSPASPGHNSNIWYIGKGVKANSYYKFKIQDHDTNEGQPFTMTLYFKDFNKKEGYWIVPVYIIDDQGKVINGTFHLSARD